MVTETWPREVMRMIGESTTNKHIYTRCHETKQKENNIVNTNLEHEHIQRLLSRDLPLH